MIIIFGVMVECVKLEGYMIFVVMIGFLIYLIVGYWVWGSLLIFDNELWFVFMGFMDFVGFMVVYFVGVWIFLVVIIIIGFCIGCFENGEMCEINGYSVVFVIVGCIILWVGWIGFNGGLIIVGILIFV